MAVHNLTAAGLVVGAPAKPKRQRTRKPSLVSVAKQAAKAGLEVARYEVDPDGKIIIVTGKPDDMTTGNPWDEVLTNVTH